MFHRVHFAHAITVPRAVALLVLLLAAGLAARPVQPVSAAAHSVSIANFAFAPANLTIAAGDTVTWTNNDQTAHTSTSDNGAWDSGPLQPGASFSHTFTTAGTFSYHCSIHPFMTATITVTAAPAAQPAAAPASAAQPAQPAAPASSARTQAAAGQSAAGAPQLPSTGNGGLLDQSDGINLVLLAWLLSFLAGVALVGGGLALRMHRSAHRDR